MNERIFDAQHATSEEYKEWNYNAEEWNFENALKICRRIDCFQVKKIARSILQGELSGELSDKIYNRISDSCFYNLLQVIQNALMFMRLSNRSEFKIQDFKSGLVGAYKFDSLPSELIVDDSCKFAVDNFP